MIISRLSGGLGNQMFQFAAAKALSLQKKTDLILDCTRFKIEKDLLTPRDFELSIFDRGDFKFLKESETKKILEEEVSAVQKIWNKFVGKDVCQYYRQPSFAFDENYFSIPDNSYLIGYFQTEKFFSKFETEIRNCFQFPNSISDKNKEYQKLINNCNAISVHVRRGDYVKVASNLKHHGTCSNEYYQSGFEKIKIEVENPVFFFFSDDIEWVKKNLDPGGTSHYINHNTGNQSFEDMRLMSLCKHHIIANSSFSWWGAWLNSSAEKIVIAPKRWFADEEKNNTAKDIFCPEWIKIEA